MKKLRMKQRWSLKRLKNMVLAGPKNYDWGIGYYIETKKDKEVIK